MALAAESAALLALLQFAEVRSFRWEVPAGYLVT